MKIACFLLSLMIAQSGVCQKYTLESSMVSFYSDAPMEDIEAKNSKTVSIFNVGTGEIVFSIPIEHFEFEKDLMKQHFNEKYLESDKFPKATFQGKISGFTPDAKGAQEASAKGKLTIHGVTKEVEFKGTIEMTDNKPVLKSNFKILVADYKIPIPQLLWKNIAEEVEVKVEFAYKP
jgi:polyisoprenoid-binding protein YceI